MTKTKKKNVPWCGTIKRAAIALPLAMAMCLAVPQMAQAQWGVATGVNYSGVVIFTSDGSVLTAGVPAGAVNETSVTDPGTGSAAGAVITGTTGTFSFTSINMEGSVNSQGVPGNHSLLGLIFVNDSAFGGTINGGDITVNATEGEVLGVFFRRVNGGKADIDGANITIGDITAKTLLATGHEDDGAYGFAAGTIGATSTTTITTGFIEVESATGAATGMHLDGDVLSNATIVVAGISAKTSAPAVNVKDARGLLVGKDGFIGNVQNDISGSITIGTIGSQGIYAEAVRDAYGVQFGDLKTGGNLTVNGDIETHAGRWAYGIAANAVETNSSINSNNIDVYAGTGGEAYGIWAAGAVSGNINAGTITAQSASGQNAAFVAGMRIDGVLTGKVNVSEINALGSFNTGYGATGFYTKDVVNGAEISLGDVTVEGGYAIGANFQKDFDGSLTANSMNVTSGEHNANGIIFGHEPSQSADFNGSIVVTNDLVVKGNTAGLVRGIYVMGDADGTITAGSISAENTLTTAGGPGDYAAYGIQFDGDAAVTLDVASISANAVLGEAVGIKAGSDLDLTLAGDLDVQGSTEGIQVANDLNVALGGNDLTTNSVVAGGDATFTGAGNVTVTGDVSAGGDAIFTNVGTGSIAGLLTADNLDINGSSTIGIGSVAVGGNADFRDTTNTTINGGTIGGTVGVDTGANLTLKNTGIVGTTTILGEMTTDSVVFGDDVIIGDGTAAAKLTLDKNSEFQGTGNELNANATLVLWDAADGTILEDIMGNQIQWANLDPNSTVEGGLFTDWVQSGNVLVAKRGALKIGDAFLAAGAMHNRFTARMAVTPHMISNPYTQNAYGYGYLGQAPEYAAFDPCDPVCNPCGSFSNVTRNAWVNYVGRHESFGNWDLSSDGVQVGTDLIRSKKNQLGLLFGYEDTLAQQSVNRIDAEDMYVGVFAAHVFRNGADIRALYNYGWQEFDMVRGANRAKFDGNTQEIALDFGKRYHNGFWSIRPMFGMDFFLNHLDAVTESGASTPVHYNKLDYTQWFLRSGFDLQYHRNRFTFNTGLSYAYDVKGDSYDARVRATGSPFWGTLRGTALGREVVSFNVGGAYQISKNVSIFGGYDGQVVLDRSDDFLGTGSVGAKITW